MKSKKWLMGWVLIVLLGLGYIAGCVYTVDPFFHYHKPKTEKYYYSLYNQRSQNDGILKNFDYDAMIIGTSMTENFLASECNEIFGVNSVKTPNAGGTYNEINKNIETALKNNKELKTVIRGLDYSYIFDEKDRLREDLGKYPTYLYDTNPFNDVEYLFNKDVIFGQVYSMHVESKKEGFAPGITPFDEYSNWNDDYTYGKEAVIPNGIVMDQISPALELTDQDKEIIEENITQNITDLADQYPDVTFYYFFTPYSVVWWKNLVVNGGIYRNIQGEKYAIELILEHENIKLYSFNDDIELTTNLDNYRDPQHYGQWVNSEILKWIYEGKGLLTKENYEEYIINEQNFYASFDYLSLNR